MKKKKKKRLPSNQRKFRDTYAKPMSERSLTKKQEYFCQLYVRKGTKFFGNGARSYAEAYDIDMSSARGNRNARVGAHDNLMKPNILERVNSLLELEGFNDATADRELLFVIEQKAELGPKVQAIKEYNNLKARITKKLELSGGLASDNLTPEDREAKVRAEIEQVLNDKK